MKAMEGWFALLFKSFYFKESKHFKIKGYHVVKIEIIDKWIIV